MKSLYKSLTIWLLCLFYVFSSFIVSFADAKSLMIGSSSNALMTLELDDSDYSVMPMSSIGTVTNTIEADEIEVNIQTRKVSGGSGRITTKAVRTNGRYKFSYILPEGSYVDYFEFHLLRGQFPSSGNYKFSFDFSSDFAFDYREKPYIWTVQSYENASDVYNKLTLTGSQSYSGDLYQSPIALRMINCKTLDIICPVSLSDNVTALGGSFAIRFEKTSEEGVNIGSSSSSSTDEYYGDVSSSLSDLSSSVDSMAEDLSSASENLEYISTSQNLIIQGIDNVIMHISDQLYAFWDQLFNLIHLPTLAKMDDIISAINNMDLEIEVNLDGLKTTINNMSTAVQNKLQSTTDQITGGYDNSGMSSDKSELDGVLNQYEQAEEDLFDDAKGNINDFEFDTPLEQFTGPLSDVSYFLSGLFDAMGPMNVIITFSLTLTIAMVMIGWYRFKGGR